MYDHRELGSFSILKEFSDGINGDINKHNFLIKYSEMCQQERLV